MLGGKHHGALSDSEMLNAMKFLPGKGINFTICHCNKQTKTIRVAC